MLGRVALGGFAALFAFLLVELVLRVVPVPFVYMSMRNVVQRDCTRPHPVMQYVNRENYRGMFRNREFRTTVRINAKGLRGPEFPYERPPGRERLLLLGDSFAFGWGVEEEEDVAGALQRRLPAAEVINGACSGWNTLQELQFLRLEGLRYHPAVVLLFFCENDPGGNEARYKFVDGRLWDADEPETRSADVRRWLIRHSAAWNLLRYGWNRARGRIDGEGEPPEQRPGLWHAEEEYLRQMVSLCADDGARFAVVYVPNKGTATAPAAGIWLAPLKEFCARQAVPLLDLTGPLAEAGRREPVYFRIDDHWSPAGHRVAAEAAARLLQERGWVGGG
jgi:lysophospholipase L1-like esterase